MKNTSAPLWICALIAIVGMPFVGIIETPKGLFPLWIWFEIPLAGLFLIAVYIEVKNSPLPATPEKKDLVKTPLPILKISYAMVTVPRKKSHIERTIKSLEDTGFFDRPEHLPLRIVAASHDYSHLQPYMEDSRFLVDTIPKGEAQEPKWNEAGNSLGATFGHRRALSNERMVSGSEHLMVFEDDIIFSEGWIPRFERILEEAKKDHKDNFILSLYLQGPHTQSLEAYKKGSFYVDWPHHVSFGVQAMLYPLFVRDEFMRITKDCPNELPHDMALGKNLKLLNIPVLMSAPSLVQHIGLESGERTSRHESLSFLAKLDMSFEKKRLSP